MRIAKVSRRSLAKDLGFEKGDEILAFDGYPCESELDYQYYMGKTNFFVTVKNFRNGETQEIAVEKEENEDLGLTFEKNENIRTCHNRCVFCFVDQMPKGMRKSLYIKDDDYEMSFTCGNFVTLTNVTDEQLNRIIRLHLSPLYISVHTMNPELRVELLRNRFAGKIVEQIKRLAENGIEVHCQAVVVPHKNDGDELAYTARELFKYYPTVRDLACVPTGLTKYRDGLTEIPDVDKEYSQKMLDLVDSLNAEFGVNFLLPADEYFVRAEREMKPTEFYGNFEQIENGVGMTRDFLENAEEILRVTPQKTLKKPKKVLLISGVSAKKINEDLAEKVMRKVEGLTVEVLAVENEFFGKTVTCTGLLTGIDIANAVLKHLQTNEKPDEIILPSNTMKEFEEVFLCGMTLKELKKRVGCKITVNSGGGSTLVGELTKK